MDSKRSYGPLPDTQKSAISNLALKFSVSPPYYPWVTATFRDEPVIIVGGVGHGLKLFFSYFFSSAMRLYFPFFLDVTKNCGGGGGVSEKMKS